ncbi:branched-chain amino acid ABC transporter permease [Natronococcus jeotgali]|uniref:Inner-membrane translocator n=1 Tax=Natronococcus jeotgali DSM 18795 TaxID=1227498 RepID=L9X442_9EURY|nr:branched-chain amino acid ABC transporter permease [Natronococcus jeotgali]ELY56392.1 inner-membrane translocator [Natronococcus jeotgali DSM 18795]
MSTHDDSVTSRIGEFTRDAVRNGWTRERCVVLLSLGLLLFGVVAPSFQIYLFTEFLIIALFALAFNLLYGYTGLLSFGHAMFLAGGSYGLAIFLQESEPYVSNVVGAGPAPLVSWVLGAVFAVSLVIAMAVPIGWLSVRLEEIYFALITLAFGMLVYSVIIQNPQGLTAGSDGINVLLGVTEIGGAEFRLGDRQIYYYLTLGIVGASTYGIWRIVNSPFGTICKSIRESPERAAALGVDVRFHRWMTFIVSAAFVGIAGVLIAGLSNVASPYHAHWSESATAVVATVIGGATYFAGPIIGAFVYLYARWGISRYPALEAHWEFFMGVLIILVVLYFKVGAAGGLYMLRTWLLDVQAAYRRGGANAAVGFVRESATNKLRRDSDASESDTGGVER